MPTSALSTRSAAVFAGSSVPFQTCRYARASRLCCAFERLKYLRQSTKHMLKLTKATLSFTYTCIHSNQIALHSPAILLPNGKQRLQPDPEQRLGPNISF